MEFLDATLKFFFGKEYKITQKTAVITIVTIIVLWVNSVTGFSFYYSTGKQIEYLEKISSIINDPRLDTISKINAIKIRDDLIARKDAYDYLASFTLNTKQTTWNIIRNRGSDFIFFMTSSGIIFLSVLVLAIISFFVNRGDSLVARLAISIGGTVAMGILCFLLTFFLAKVPVISHQTLFWNYALNFLVQGVIILLFVRNIIKKSPIFPFS